jgi:putative DNA primase/helicase
MPRDHGVDTTLPTVEGVDRRTFLRAIFPADLMSDSETATVTMPWTPDDSDKTQYLTSGITDWRGRYSKATHFSPASYDKAAMKPNGRIVRSTQNFRAMYALVLDDVLSKVPMPHLAPSWVVETRPGSWQVGFLLDQPITDPDTADNLIFSAGLSGVTDNGATKITQLFRLPGSQPPGKDHAARLIAWHPEVSYTVEEIYAGLELTRHIRGAKLGEIEPLDASVQIDDPLAVWIRQQPWYRGNRSGTGYEEIVCPWCSGHTDKRQDTAGYRMPLHELPFRSFSCFHEHCAGRTTGDFIAWCVEQGGPNVPVAYHVQRDINLLEPFLSDGCRAAIAENMVWVADRVARQRVINGARQASRAQLDEIVAPYERDFRLGPDEDDVEAAAAHPRERSRDWGATLTPATNYMVNARTFVNQAFGHEDGLRLVCWQGTFHVWRDARWHVFSNAEMEQMLWHWGAVCRVRVEGTTSVFMPAPPWVKAMMAAVTAISSYHGESNIAWLSGSGPNPARLMPMANGILDLKTRRLLPITPRLFNTVGIAADYDPDAQFKDSRFESWLKLALIDERTGEGEDQIRLLQEMLGYLLTGQTFAQKAFMITGKTRGGKGTLAALISELFYGAVASISAARLSGSFPLQSLIGKSVAILPDVRVDKMTKFAPTAELLLSITGGDMQSVARKGLTDWTGTLPVRLVMISNSIPALRDEDGALAGRFIYIQMPNSFMGREDPMLLSRLLSERSVIVNWALEGYARLMKKGRFSTTDRDRATRQGVAVRQNPVGSFIDQYLDITGDREDFVQVEHLWAVFAERFAPEHRVTTFNRDAFMRHLWLKMPAEVTQERRRAGGPKVRFAHGLCWKADQNITEDVINDLISYLGDD